MRSIIMLSINGSTFFFEDDNFNKSQKDSLDSLAINEICYTPETSEQEIVNHFVKIVKEKLDLQLKAIDISHIIRIK